MDHQSRRLRRIVDLRGERGHESFHRKRGKNAKENHRESDLYRVAFFADPVYRLLGTDGIAGVRDWPSVDTSVGGMIHYHVRTGGHDVTSFDWKCYLDFADRYLK